MFNKINTKTLVTVFIILLIIVVLILISDKKKGHRSFKADLVELDSAGFNKITIYPRSDNQPVEIKKHNGQWMVKSKDTYYPADEAAVDHMISEMMRLRARRVAATSKDKWEQYEVTDSLATRVKVNEDKKSSFGLYIGKFSYQQPENPDPYSRQQGKMTTYVRLAGEKEVYAVEGFLGMTFNRKVSDLRNKTVINSPHRDWTRLSYNYPADSSFILQKEGDKWMIDGIAADSASVVNYFSRISRLSSTDFVDNASPGTSSPLFTMTIEGNNFEKPVVVNAFPTDSTHKYLISTSQNENIYFSDVKAGLANKIFKGKSAFKAE